MKEAHRVSKRVLDEHALGITGDEAARGGSRVIGEQDGGLVMPEVADEELAVATRYEANLLLEGPGCAVFAMGQIERHCAPGGCRQLVDFGEQAWRASAQGHEGDALAIEAIEPVIGG